MHILTHVHAVYSTHTQDTHSSGAVLSEKALHVSSSHELQKNKSGQDLKTDSNTTHYVLMVELTAKTHTHTQTFFFSLKYTPLHVVS